MARKRLSDTSIQELLDKAADGRIADNPHIDAESRQEAAKYAALFELLHRQPPMRLSTKFPDRVLQRIEQRSSSQPGYEFWQFVLIGIGFVIAITVTAFLGGLQFLKPGMLYSAQVIQALSELFGRISFLNSGLHLLAAGLAALFLLHAVDHWMRQRRTKMLALFRQVTLSL